MTKREEADFLHDEPFDARNTLRAELVGYASLFRGMRKVGLKSDFSIYAADGKNPRKLGAGMAHASPCASIESRAAQPDNARSAVGGSYKICETRIAELVRLFGQRNHCTRLRGAHGSRASLTWDWVL
jgi:hypothetical protein